MAGRETLLRRENRRQRPITHFLSPCRHSLLLIARLKRTIISLARRRAATLPLPPRHLSSTCCYFVLLQLLSPQLSLHAKGREAPFLPAEVCSLRAATIHRLLPARVVLPASHLNAPLPQVPDTKPVSCSGARSRSSFRPLPGHPSYPPAFDLLPSPSPSSSPASSLREHAVRTG